MMQYKKVHDGGVINEDDTNASRRITACRVVCIHLEFHQHLIPLFISYLNWARQLMGALCNML